MRKKFLAFSLFLPLVFFSLTLSSGNLDLTYAQQGEAEYSRGANYETWTYPNGTVIWSSASQYVWNDTQWVSHVLQDLYNSEGKYVVQTGLVAAEIYDYYVKIFDPNMADVRVYDERWEVQKWKTTGQGGWENIGAQSGTPTITVVEYDDGVNITKAFHSWAGWLNITYVFRQNLKHTVTFISELASEEIFQPVQMWAGIVGDKVKHRDGISAITSALVINGTWFEFLKADDSLSVFEDQHSMSEYLEPLTVDVHAQGMKCNFIFSNWTLNNGESLTIDPDTTTEISATADTWADELNPDTNHGGDGLLKCEDSTGNDFIPYFKFDISSIPAADQNITDAELCTYGKRPNPQGHDSTIYLRKILADSWTEYGLKYNNRPSFGDSITSKSVTSSTYQWYNWTCTAYVKSEYDGADYTISFALDHVGSAEDYAYFVSREGTEHPVKLKVTYSPENYTPSIGEFQAPSIVYGYQQVMLNATVGDGDGKTTLKNASLTLSVDSLVLKWDNSSNTFSMDDINNKWELVSGTRTSVNTTAYKLTWTVKAYWNSTEGYVSITEAKVYDDQDANGTNTESDWFYNENDLIIDSANVDDSRTDPSQALTSTGQIYYNGTTTAPYTTSGIIAKVELSGALKGSNSSIGTDGSFTVDFNAESSYAQHSYNIYCETDEVSTQNQTVNVVVDRLNVTDGGVSDSHTNYGATETMWFKVHYQYDNTVFNGTYGTVYVNGSAMSWSSGNNRWEKTYSYDAAIKYTFKVSSVTDAQYGLTGLNDDAGGQDITWDRIQVLIDANSTNPDAGQTVQSSITATYEYDGTPVTSWTVNILRNETHFATGNFTDSSASEITYQYTTENLTENTYGLTVFTTNTLTVRWANLFIEVNQITVDDTRIDINTNATLYYHCRYSSNQSDCTTGTLYVNGTGYSINGTGWATIQHSEAAAGTKALTLTGVDVNGETNYGQIPADPEVTWDRIEVYYFEVDDGHVNVGDSVEVHVKARLESDNHPLGSGDTILINGSSASWDSTNAWFERSFTENSESSYGFTVSSASEATYGISVVYHGVSQPSATWDSLEVFNLQPVEFLGDGKYRYRGQIRYGYSQNLINGASLRAKYPNGALTKQLSSNTTGWCAFILSQSNASQTGTYTLYGTNDNTYGVTYMGTNQTFIIRSLKLTTKDHEDNSLGDTTIKVYNSSTLVHSPSSGATATYPETSYSVDVYWLEDLLVNQTSISLTTNTNQDLNCTCYPFTVDSSTYHVSSNATIASTDWNSTTNKIIITFSAATDTYILVSSATTEPTYVLNCTYDIDTDFGSYLVLNHYGNTTITLGYPNWASTRIHSTDHRITNTYWATEEKLYVVLTGSSGDSGILEIYCGSRNNPQSTDGLSDPIYFSGTTILAGTYTFSSTTTVTIDWTTTGGGSTTTPPSIFATAQTIDLGNIQQGTEKTFNATATWSGSTSITLADIAFTGDGSEWLTIEYAMPHTVKRLAIETEGTINIPITLGIPTRAQLGDYKVLVEYTISVGTRKYQTTAHITWTVTATPVPPAGIPEIVSALLFISLVGIALISIKKR